MQEIILLGDNKILPFKAAKISQLVGGILFLAQGIYHLHFNYVPTFSIGIGILLTLAGAFLIANYNLSYGKKSKYAPKVAIRKDDLLLKKSLLAPSKALPWKDIADITLGAYSMAFGMTDGHNYNFKYDTHADTSIALKAAIRKSAEERGLQVYGG